MGGRVQCEGPIGNTLGFMRVDMDVGEGLFESGSLSRRSLIRDYGGFRLRRTVG